MSNDESEAFTRYGRLSCLVMKEGTSVLRNYITSHLPGNTSLEGALLNDKAKFQTLLKKRNLTVPQFQVLFPQSGGSPPEYEIDITLWIIIGRNVTLEPQVNMTAHDWKVAPSDKQKTPGHDFVRLREARNKLAHMSIPELDNATFSEMWGNIAGALLRLGSTAENIDTYAQKDLDPETSRKVVLEMKEQSLEELFHVYIRETENKAYMKKFLLIILAVAVCLIITIVVPLVLYFRPEQPCDEFRQSKYTNRYIIEYMPRNGWRAQPPRTTEKLLHLPVPYVIFTDTASVQSCGNSADCCSHMRTLQRNMMRMNFSDIAYSYVIGNDGIVYEGRGHTIQPYDTIPLNNESYIIALDGSFYSELPSSFAMNAAYGFLTYLLEKGYVTHNFTVYAMCQVNIATPCSPGPPIYARMKKWHGHLWSWRERIHGSHCAENSTTCYF